MAPRRKTSEPVPESPAPAPPPESPPLADSAAVWLPIAQVRPWDKNPRRNDKAIPKVAESIRRFGFVAPAVVWREGDRLVAGHTRMAALAAILAVEPGFIPRGAPPGVLPGMLPVRFHAFASDEEADAYGVADNRLNELAEWDETKLQDLLEGMSTPLLDLTGFSLELPELPGLSQTTALGAPPGSPVGALFAASDDELKLPPRSSSKSVTERCIRFDGFRLAMTEPEGDKLRAALEAFKARTGTYDGFMAYVLTRL